FLAAGVAAAGPSNDNLGEPNMFGLTPVAPPDITSQTGSVYENIAYGTQTFDFNSDDMTPWVAAFLTENVTVDGDPLSLDTPLIFDDVQAHVIDKVWFNNIGEQQILFPAIDGTNIERGVIDIHHFGPDIGYIYIDLVG